MKKKIFALCLCIAMIAIAVVGGTLAYFTDEAAQKNTFTAGKLDIKLDEAVVEKDDDPESETYGDLLATGERTEEPQEYKLFPGMDVDKDPTITLLEESEDAYIASIVTVNCPGLYDLAGVEGYDTLNIHALVSGGLLVIDSGEYVTWNDLFCYETDECYIHQVADKANGIWTFYIFMKDPLSAGDDVTLFEQLNVSSAYDNEEMAILNGMTIDVKAYGTQTVGFADCYAAMTGAFPAAFAF